MFLILISCNNSILPGKFCFTNKLHGSRLGEFWKYRVGDYRLICKIEDDRLVVLVLRIGDRKEIHRQHFT
jgi:addiction module RelE/StbE family toxin